MARFRWKGRLVTEAVYLQRLKQVEVGRKKKKLEAKPIPRNRIVNLEVMVRHMKCSVCKSRLQLNDIEDETRKGLASLLKIRCSKCLLLNVVPTSDAHQDKNERTLYNVNTAAALGTVHAGFGHEQLGKFLGTLEIPTMSSATYKFYEREVGTAIEKAAKESCRHAIKTEKQLTVENHQVLEKLLPPHLQSGFLLPDSNNNSMAEPSDLQNDSTSEETVRVFASFGMGWSKRGTGHQYDSLNGYAALMGTQSKRVLDFVTKNRKCRFCDQGHPTSDHDCRLNFHGSAKAMEPAAAVDLAVRSKLMKEQKVEIGVFIGDNDSCSIRAVKDLSDHEVVKHSDKNHTAKGIKNVLYKIGREKDPDHEMNSTAIKHIHRCFTYAMAQHVGHPKNMEAAIRNIPYHIFNLHENCGEWCRYVQDPVTYRPTITPLKNNTLFDELIRIFENVAKNVEKFAAGASSQANESLNSMMARKCPKASCYSKSESSDQRFACTVLQKNEGEAYIQKVFTELTIPTGNTLQKRVTRVQAARQKRITITSTPEWKNKRQVVQRKRTLLKTAKEKQEGVTYERNVDLCLMPTNDDHVPNPMVETLLTNTVDCQVSLNNVSAFSGDREEPVIVYFDLETGGTFADADVLQIAMKCGEARFNKYICPTRNIPSKVSDINGLTYYDGDLLLHGQPVPAYAKRVVMMDLLRYLVDLKHACILVAHNCSFDAPRLIKLMEDLSLTEQFGKIIQGFSDSLKLFRNRFPNNKSHGALKLTTLAREKLSIAVEGAHEAGFDVELLEKLVRHHFSSAEIVNITESFETIATRRRMNSLIRQNIGSLGPLHKVVSNTMLRRLAGACISYKDIVEKFKTQGESETIALLEQRVNDKPTLIKRRNIVSSILEHVQQL